MAVQTAQGTVLDLQHEIELLRARVAELETWNRAAERAAEALARNEDALRKIFDHSNDGILVVDPDRDRIVDVNRRGCEMLGYAQQDLLALRLSALHPDGMERLREFARRVRERGVGSTGELSCRTRSGHRLSVEISASAVELSTGSYLIALVRDVSERKKAEEELRCANARMRADLDAAADMQRALLPVAPPQVEGLRVAWHVEPSERLGGDTLSIFRLDQDLVGFFLIDVSGHGVKAAMLSVALHRVLCPFPIPGSLLVEPPVNGRGGPRIGPPRRVAARLNRMFPMDADGGQYFTMFYGVLNVESRELHFVSAGQGAPVVVPKVGDPVQVERFDLPIGILPGAVYRDHRLTLEAASRFYVYSDGLWEATDPRGEEFGRARVLASLERQRPRSLQGGLLDLVREVREWSASPLRDDVSLLALELTR